MKIYFPPVIFLVLVSLFLPFGHTGGTLDPNHIFGFFWIYFLTGLALIFLSQSKTIYVSKEVVAISLLPVVTTFGIYLFAAEGTIRVYFPYLNFFVCLFLVFLAISIFRNTKDQRQAQLDFKLLNFWLGLAALVVVYLSSDTLRGDASFEFFGLIQKGAFAWGSLRQPNLYATALCTMLMLSYWLSLKSPPGFQWLAVSILIWAIISAEIWSVGSRINYISLSIGSIWLIGMALRSKRIVYSLAVGLSVVAGFLLSQQFDLAREGRDLLSRIEDGNNMAVSIRLAAWKAAWLIGLDSPVVGNGFDTFRYLFPDLYIRDAITVRPYGHSVIHPHNEVLYLWASGGVLGLMGILIPLLYLVVRFVGKEIAGYAVLLPTALHSNVEYPLHSASVHLVLILLFLACVAAVRPPNDESPSVRLPKWLLCCLGGFSLICSVLAVDATRISHLAFLNAFEWSGQGRGGVSYESYLEARDDDEELNHWLYRYKAEINHKANLSTLALELGDAEKVEKHLPDLKALVRQYNGQKYWLKLAAAYNGLGMRAHLIGFLDYVEKLDPSLAGNLRNYYRIN